MKVLFCEDDSEISDIIVDVLSDEGFEVECCLSSLEALKSYEKAIFQVVLTDIEMPGMNGIELVNKIKEINPNQSVVFLSAYDFKDYQDELTLKTNIKFLSKPIALDKLIESLR